MKLYVVRMKRRLTPSMLKVFHTNEYLKSSSKTGCLTIGPINLKPRGTVTLSSYTYEKWEKVLKLAERVGAISIEMIETQDTTAPVVKEEIKKPLPVKEIPVAVFEAVEEVPAIPAPVVDEPVVSEAAVPVEEEISLEVSNLTDTAAKKKGGRKKTKFEE